MCKSASAEAQVQRQALPPQRKRSTFPVQVKPYPLYQCAPSAAAPSPATRRATCANQPDQAWHAAPTCCTTSPWVTPVRSNGDTLAADERPGTILTCTLASTRSQRRRWHCVVRAFSQSAARGVPDLPRRLPGPAFAGMGEAAHPAIADEPGDLRDCQVTLFQTPGGEIGAELVDYLVKG